MAHDGAGARGLRLGGRDARNASASRARATARSASASGSSRSTPSATGRCATRATATPTTSSARSGARFAGPATILAGQGLRSRRVLAAGESQSAMHARHLHRRVRRRHPLAPSPFDGYPRVQPRHHRRPRCRRRPQAEIAAPTPARIRTDVRKPVLVLDTESDVVGLGAAAAANPTPRASTSWEVAGAAHADAYTLVIGSTDTGDPASDARCSRPCARRPRRSAAG